MRFRLIAILISLAIGILSNAQQLGGNTVYNFINQPNSAQLSALGGVNISNITNDVSMSFANPALLRQQMNLQLSSSFNNYFAGIRNYSATSAWYLSKSSTNIALGVNYFDYGNITQTDAAGNILGNFHPNDNVLQIMASRKYLQHWWYGATLKFISSNYGQYRSNGLAVDIGINYYDSVHLFQVGFVTKNWGAQLKSYSANSVKEQLPFDMQLGVTKRLAHAPIQFSLTAHHLQAFNMYYSDSSFNNFVGDNSNSASNSALNKIVSHLVLATQFFISDQLEITAAFNFLNRHDLNIYNTTNGLNGFTLGIGAYLKKIHLRYATGFYQQNMFHQISLNIDWKGNTLFN